MIFSWSEHSILSDVEEERPERFLVPALASSRQEERHEPPQHQLQFYLQFSPCLPGLSDCQ